METLSNMTLQQRVHSVIVHNSQLSNCDIQFQADEDGKLTIEGEAQSFFAKQMAQEILRGVDGVSSIENELTVNWE